MSVLPDQIDVKPGDWSKFTVFLPPGWKDAVLERALGLHQGKRGKTNYVWAAAVDWVLSIDQAELSRRVRELEAQYADDYAGLVARHCNDPALVAQLAAQQSSTGDSAKKRPARRRTRAR